MTTAPRTTEPGRRPSPKNGAKRPSRSGSPVAAAATTWATPRRPARSSSPFALADLLLAITLVVYPHLMGGKHPVAELVLVGLAAAQLVLWGVCTLFAKQPLVRLSVGEWLLGSGLALMVLQLTPLPAEEWGRISPAWTALLPLWQSNTVEGGLGEWVTLSIAPGATRRAACLMAAHLAVYWVALQRLRTLADLRRVLTWMAAAAAAMALLGLVQRFAPNGKFWWIYEHPFMSTDRGVVLGAFANRNHFAQFLAMGFGLQLWKLVDGMSVAREAATGAFGGPRTGASPALMGWAMAAAVTAFALLLSLSRGGIVALGLVVLLSLMFFALQGRLSAMLVGSFVAMSCMVLAGLAIFGADRLSERLEDWESQDRLRIWQANWIACERFPWVGTGACTHAEVYPLHLATPTEAAEYTHAESSYFQVASEFGGAGLALAGLGLLTIGVWSVRGLWQADADHRLAAAAMTACLAGHTVHALFDFIWYTPAITLTALVLAAGLCCVGRLSSRNTSGFWGRSFARGLALGAVLLGAMGGWVGATTLQGPVLAAGPWNEYLRLLTKRDNEDHDAAETAAAEGEAVRWATLTARAAEHDPHDARMQLRAAQTARAAFDALQLASECPLSSEQLRDAAVASRFATRAAQREWLSTVCGDRLVWLERARDFAERALRQCPLQGEAWLILNDVEFIDQLAANDAVRLARMEQAALVRPHHGRLLFALGREAFLKGDASLAVRRWREAAESDHLLRPRVVELLAGVIPLETFLDEFRPDWQFQTLLVTRYATRAPQSEDYQLLLKRYVTSSIRHARRETNLEASQDAWQRAFWSLQQLQQPQALTKVATMAAKMHPNAYDFRRQIAAELMTIRAYPAAREHLEWCLDREPGDDVVRKWLDQAATASLKEGQRG